MVNGIGALIHKTPDFPCGSAGRESACNGGDLRDGIGKEVGGGFRMGDTCTPVADSCECMAKTTTIL